jgi:ABC-type Zn uptake system ZnuABC Zn-binding protein ZnuA
MRLSIIAAVSLFCILVAGCGADEDASPNGKLRAVTTLPLFADFVREIGGEGVEVTSIIPPGADPHTWEPSPSDITAVTEADIAFANGLDLEPGAVGVIQPNLSSTARLVLIGVEAESAGAAVAALPEGFEEDEEEAGGEDHGEDPHLWMDPRNAAIYAGIIRDALALTDPDGESSYDQNYEAYLSKLQDVEEYIVGKVAQIPEENRKLVTTHDAFGYFATAYDLQIVAFVAPGPGQEPSPEDIAQLTEAMRREAVPAVFVEPQVETEGDILEQAAADAGVQVCTLYSDSLDDKVTNYIDLMRFNADSLARCLGGVSGG